MEAQEDQPKQVDGFLILNNEGKFLEHNNLTWFDHEGNPKDAYVYTRQEVDHIVWLSKSNSWHGVKPTHVIEATWNPSSGVIAHEHEGKMEIPISELPPVEQK